MVETDGVDAALRLGGDTRRTCAVNVKVVPGCAKTLGQFRPALGNTPLQVVQLPAVVALKVVMMFFARHFVPLGISRYFDRLQPSFLNQRLDVSVHRGNPNTRMVLLCRLENFFRRQRPVGSCKSLSNGSLLSGVSNLSGAQSNLLCARLTTPLDPESGVKPRLEMKRHRNAPIAQS